MTEGSIDDARSAFEALYRQTCRPLLAHLRRRAPGPEAEDLLAEVYLVAWRRRDQLPEGAEQRLWLYGVARRLLVAHHRTTAGSPAGPGLTETGAPSYDTGSHHQGAASDADERTAIERDEAVRVALASLPDVDRELVTLTVWDELSTAAAARVLGLSPVTARVRLHRARARLARNARLVALLDEDADRNGGRAGPRGSSSAGAAPPPQEGGAAGPVRPVLVPRNPGELPSPG